MRFRLHADTLHVHRCAEHRSPCDFFDHAPSWLFANRAAARDQLMAYRISVSSRIAALSLILVSIDAMLERLHSLRAAA